jgi:hypothetical protein
VVSDRLGEWLSADWSDRARAPSDHGREAEAEALVADALARQPKEPAQLLLAARSYRRHAENLRKHGPAGGAEQAERKALEWFEKLLALQPDPGLYVAEFTEFLLSKLPSLWEVLEPPGLAAASGTTLTRQPNGSILASGVNKDLPLQHVEELKACRCKNEAASSRCP